VEAGDIHSKSAAPIPTDDAPRRPVPPPSPALKFGVGSAVVLLAFADLFIQKHGSFAIEHTPVFYGSLAFLVAGALIIVAEALRHLLSRPEDHYDR